MENNLTIKGLEITTERSWNFSYPCLKISNITNGDIGYLVPFRMYKFQVCGTKDGNMDKGGSDVKVNFLYDIIMNNNPTEAIKLIIIEVARCINGYLNTNYGYTPGRRIAVTVNGEIPYTEGMLSWEIPRHGNYDELYDVNEIEFIHQFASACYFMSLKYYRHTATA